MVTFQFLLYCASGMGITYSYHRQLAHKSFKSPKWLEYLASTCGMMAFQGSPYEWVSDQYARAHATLTQQQALMSLTFACLHLLFLFLLLVAAGTTTCTPRRRSILTPPTRASTGRISAGC